MIEKKNLYTADSIESLDPLQFTRLKPGVYCGDTTYATQLLVEILSNAIDEYRAGHGDVINITIEDSQVSVEDQGQGFIPGLMRDDGKSVLEASFSVLNTSGKYREDGAYEGTSLGSFGIGSKLTNFLSHWLNVITYRDGQSELVSFREGVFQHRTIQASTHHSGTYVEWEASEQFFTHPEVEINKVKSLLKTIVCLCPGLTINLHTEEEDISYYSKNGLDDLTDENVKNKELLAKRFKLNYANNKNKLDLILTYTSNYNSILIPYVNAGLTEKGPHITQIKAILTKEFNKFFREKKWLKDKDENLSGDDLNEGMFVIFNITAPDVAYNAQVKSTVTKIDMTPFTAPLSEALQEWFIYNEKEIKLIADKALGARKAREAAKKARDAVRNTSKKKNNLKNKIAISQKFTDCISKKPEERNLLLVEGTSAAGSAIEARNPQTDCIYQLRGKTISPLKTSIDKILANQEMSDIIQIIGAGFGDKFDINQMQIGKVVITSDQDSDGADIELLLTTFFFTYMRPLVEAGKLYRAVTPLYIIKQKNTEHYCYSEKEYSDWKNQHKTEKYEVLRAKGLGELDPVDLQRVCFKDQRFKRITISDAAKAEALLQILMGSAVEPRKQYIYNNATELGFNFD